MLKFTVRKISVRLSLKGIFIGDSNMNQKILCVEDSEDVQNIIRFIIKASNCSYDLVSASDGIDALEIMKDQSFDMILLDIVMPKMDGFDFLQKCREHSNSSRIPVIVISGNSEHKEKSLRLGACEFLEKPFDLEELKSLIKKHL